MNDDHTTVACFQPSLGEMSEPKASIHAIKSSWIQADTPHLPTTSGCEGVDIRCIAGQAMLYPEGCSERARAAQTGIRSLFKGSVNHVTASP